MLDDRELTIPLLPVRHADGISRATSRPNAPDAERVTALRRRVRDGYYASASMMDVVARRILSTGDV